MSQTLQNNASFLIEVIREKMSQTVSYFYF